MDFKELVKKYQKDGLKTLVKLIQIDSVYDASTISDDAPYGKGVKNAMNFMKEVALKDGFEVDTCDNRCLEISYGEGDDYIGIFAHLDVVPVSGNWKYGAFSGEIAEGKVFGRGTSDDKGPGVSAYYALKALKEANLINGYKVKLVFGGDEERGSSCLDYYFNVLKKPYPRYGFTPDGDFPLIYGEKGITNYKMSGKIFLGPIKEIKAGVVANSVIDKAIVTVSDKEKIKKYLEKHSDIDYEILNDKDNELTLNFIGKSAHGSLPLLGKNSGIIALKALGEAYDLKILKDIAFDYLDPLGHNLNQYYSSEKMGETTYNVGLISYVDGVFSMTVNFRYPENVDLDHVIEEIQKDAQLPIEVLSKSECLYYDPELPFIKTLENVYVSETGDTINKPMTIGGGTYAKEAKNTVAFGSHFPGKEDHIHEENEKIDLEDFYNSMSLYAHAIDALGHLK